MNCRGETLKGVLHLPARAGRGSAAILCHGMESNKESEKLVALSRSLSERGIVSLRFDFSCAGESSGRFEEITYSGEVEDLKAAFQFMLRYHIQKIGILGSSMGGSVALLFAAQEKRVAALVTVAAPVHPQKIIQGLLTQKEIQGWHRNGFIDFHGRRMSAALLVDVEKIDILKAVEKISCPVLVVHGDADGTVSVEEAHELYAHLTGPKRLCILKGADHRLSNPSLLDQALRESLDWMGQHLLQDGATP